MTKKNVYIVRRGSLGEPNLSERVPDGLTISADVPEELKRRLQPDEAAKRAPCGLRRAQRIQAQEIKDDGSQDDYVIDYNCMVPNCLINGGKCTGIRFIPDPTIPLATVALDAQVYLALEVRRSVKRELKDKAPNMYLTQKATKADIENARVKFKQSMVGPVTMAPPARN